MKSKLMRSLKWFKRWLGDFITGKSIELLVTETNIHENCFVCVVVDYTESVFNRRLRQLRNGNLSYKIKDRISAEAHPRELLGFYITFIEKPLIFMTLIGFQLRRRKFLLNLTLTRTERLRLYGPNSAREHLTRLRLIEFMAVKFIFIYKKLTNFYGFSAECVKIY